MARAVGRSRQPLREACGGWAKRKHDARPDTPLTESVRSTYSSGRAFHFLKSLGSSHTPSSRPDQAMRPNQNKARASDEREQERRRPDSDDRDERRMQRSLVPFVDQGEVPPTLICAATGHCVVLLLDRSSARATVITVIAITQHAV
jgi:hypothetical protein